MILKDPSKPLQVFNASAGSGKTHSLVKEYIKLLISQRSTDKQFSKVIAMTFTNKAALEMKHRIVEALNEIGSDKGDSSILRQLVEETELTEEYIIEKCNLVLQRILHNYEDFHVMTIDKFNLRLIKSFGRDLDLPNDFEVVMDESEIIEKIVDRIISDLGTEGNSVLSNLLLSYAKENIEEGDKWNFRQALVKFGNILNKEQNNSIVENLLMSDFSLDKFKEVRKIQRGYNREIAARVEKLNEIFRAVSLNSDMLPGKSNTYKAIQKLANLERFPEDRKYATDSFRNNLEIPLKENQEFPESIKSAILEFISYCDAQFTEYETISLFLKNFFNMALLQYMAVEIKKVHKEENIIRISEFNTLISELIQKENALFVYERLGTRFHNFLLDEFQDTSRLQWLNLVPLIHDSISNNRMNLIVGDPKQSIYRFKNGVAEQFVALPKIFNPEKDRIIGEHSMYFDSMGETHDLPNNWRSAKNIVNTNNLLFERLKKILSDNTISFYNSIKQIPVSKNDGKIHIYSKEEELEEGALIKIIHSHIQDCLKAGFKANDICILGNTNRETNSWAIQLTKMGYKVVSSDSLLIRSDIDVQLAIAYLYLRLHPGGKHEMKRFAELYFRNKTSENKADYFDYLYEVKSENGEKTHRLFREAQFIKDYFGEIDEFFFRYENLYDLVQKFYNLLGFDEMSSPYLHHLADIIFEFGLKKGPDLQLFLEYYESNKNRIAVQVPVSSDAIEIMTIHKAKGLEFPVVIVPSLNFNTNVKGSFLVPVDDYIIYKQPSAKDTIEELKSMYSQESEQVIADCINKCYVALTRPVNRLYVHNSYSKNKFGAMFHQSLDVLEILRDDEAKIFTSIPEGEVVPKQRDSTKIFRPSKVLDTLWFPSISLQDKPELMDNDYLSEERRYGSQFHYVISKIETLEQLNDTLEAGIQEAVIDLDFKEKLREQITLTLKSTSYQKLFEDSLECLTEQAIIADETTVLIPDKVIIKKDTTLIIDYKTGSPKEKDKQQVREYHQLLTAMGYPNVSSFLFYIADLSLEQIT